MKLTQLTIEQFQQVANIEFTQELDMLDKKIGVISVVDKKSLDELYKEQPMYIHKRYTEIITQWNRLPAIIFKTRFKAGNKWYKPILYTDQLNAGQLIDLMSYNTSNEQELVKNLHNIMATLCCECKFYKWFPEKYTSATHKQRAEYLLQNAKIKDVWGVVSFFLLSSESYLKALQTYSNNNLKKM